MTSPASPPAAIRLPVSRWSKGHRILVLYASFFAFFSTMWASNGRRPSLAAASRCSISRTSPRTVTGRARRSIFSALPGIGIAALQATSPQDARAELDSSILDLFALKCQGCHQAGGNVFGGPNLKKNDLAKNNLLDLEVLANYLAKGKKQMPGFGEECTPKRACTFGERLSKEKLQEVAEYVLSQAESDWK
ncbi:hypothetical protein AAMO2058_001541800 [Amorphochlora amoebiformis]